MHQNLKVNIKNIMAIPNNLTLIAIARINQAGQLWKMAKKQTSRKTAGACYNKAYVILQQELGTDNPITCELRKEMPR